MNKISMIDLAAEIGTYGEESYQDFEGFSSKEEQELIVNEIKKCMILFEHKINEDYIQTLCDIVLIKTISKLHEGEFEVDHYVNEILDLMVIWDDILNCRYLIKSGIDWNEK